MTREKSVSAGLLMYHIWHGALLVYLAHPGGPFFAKKDLGAWTVPKGLVNSGEEPLDAARREFEEETGLMPTPPFMSLDSIRMKSRKIVYCWAFEGPELVPEVQSNTFRLEWPPRSGIFEEFPEIDRGQYFEIEEAGKKIIPAQRPFLERFVSAAR